MDQVPEHSLRIVVLTNQHVGADFPTITMHAIDALPRRRTCDLSHRPHATFLLRRRQRGLNADALPGFALDPGGSLRESRMQALSPLTGSSFDVHDLRVVPVVAEAAE